MRFQWDGKKATRNFSKHRVQFEEAMSVFTDPMARLFDDESHSLREKRELIIGHSSRSRMLLVSFTERKESIRIISARLVTQQEREDYEENN